MKLGFRIVLTANIMAVVMGLCSDQKCIAGFFLGGAGSFSVDASTDGGSFNSFASPVDRTIGPVRFEAAGGSSVSPGVATAYLSEPTRVTYGSQPSVLGSASMNTTTSLNRVSLILEQDDLGVTPINGIRFPIVRTEAFGNFIGTLAPGDSAFFRAGWAVTETSTSGAGRGVVRDTDGNQVQGNTGIITITNSGNTAMPFSRDFFYQSGMYGPGQGDFLGVGSAATTYTSSMSILLGVTKASSSGQSWISLSNSSMQITAVPEPSSMALIGLGIAGAVVSRLRNRFNAK